MFYLSDHGESLGENNLYLHGLPYPLAPQVQKHIAALMWLGEGFKVNRDKIKRNATRQYSQDHLFHTLLGLFEVNTSVYDRSMDIIHNHE
jgi:lipid A ethanolaminephosphotransferase